MPLATFALWFLLVWGLGWLALPVVRRLWFRDNCRLPDGGLAAGRMLLLALWTLLVFWSGYCGMPTRWGWLWLVVIAEVCLWIAGRDWATLRATVRAARRGIIASELIFILTFAAFFGLRGYWPDTGNGEKPMDMALISAAARADRLPPPNPYAANVRLSSYYYFGHLETALLTATIHARPRWTYNLMAATLPALCFSMLAMLAAAVTGRIRYGAATALLVLGAGTLEPMRQWYTKIWDFSLLYERNLQFVHTLASNVEVASRMRAFLMTLREILTLDAMSTSRVIPGGLNDDGHPAFTINEYPWFTFNFADLHAHYFSMPVALLVLCLAWGLYHRDAPLRLGGWKPVLVVGAVLGVLIVTNSWDFPAYTLLCLLCLALPTRWREVSGSTEAAEETPPEPPKPTRRDARAHRRKGGAAPQAVSGPPIVPTPTGVLSSRDRLAAIALLLTSAIVLALPYLRQLRSAAQPPTPMTLAQMSSPLLPWLLMWGVPVTAWLAVLISNRHTLGGRALVVPPLDCTLAFTLWFTLNAVLRGDYQSTQIAFIVAVAVFGFTALVMGGLLKLLAGALRTREHYTFGAWSGLALLLAVFLFRQHDYAVVTGLLLLLLWTARTLRHTEDATLAWLCRLALCGLIALLWSEVTWAGFLGPPNHRQDTVFKFGLQGWYLFGTAAACGALRLLPAGVHTRAVPQWRIWPALIRAPLVWFLAAAFVGSGVTTWWRARDFAHFEGWDAWAHLAPSERAAAAWLDAHAHDGENMVEAAKEEGGDYDYDFSRYTHATGIPVILGPRSHTFQWTPAHTNNAKDEWDETFRRKDAVKAVYSGSDTALREDILKKYHVRYIISSRAEAQEYRPDTVFRAIGNYPIGFQSSPRVHDGPPVTVYTFSPSP